MKGLLPVLCLLLVANHAAAQVEIEIPTLVLDDIAAAEKNEDRALDLANVVMAAAKGVTTVQEAPAIVTVITEEAIEDRGLRQLNDIIDTLPGWHREDGLYGQIDNIWIRGTTGSALLVVDGVSMFDPFINTISVGKQFPVEMIKRVEAITGPGGVLWGANSFLGVVNVSTKSASDVDGVEAGLASGTGPGDQNVVRGYLMAGFTDLVDDLDVLLHGSLETFKAPAHEGYLTFAGGAYSQNLRGPLLEGNPKISYIANLGAKVEYKGVQLAASVPFMLLRSGLTVQGLSVQADRPEDGLPECAPDVAINNDPNDPCLDPKMVSRDSSWTFYERWLTLSHQRRVLNGSAGVDAKLYGVQFVRNVSPILAQPLGAVEVGPGIVAGNEGGISSDASIAAYRVGASLDGDLELPGDLRLLYGGEYFYEWLPDSSDGYRRYGGPQSQIAVADSENPGRGCPRVLGESGMLEYVEGCPSLFAYRTSRTVLGAYLNPQWRISERLILDGGARLQVAPERLGELDYPMQLFFSGAAVRKLSDSWYTKLNVAQGFRSPIFWNVKGNAEAGAIIGDEDLTIERSLSFQGEISGRVFRGVRRIRELDVRLNYSYTLLDDVIQVSGNQFINSSPVGIHSTELLSRLYIDGGHGLEFAYSFARRVQEQEGPFTQGPEHWFQLGGVFQVSDHLKLTSRLRVHSAFLDSNLLLEHRDLIYNEDGRSENVITGQVGCSPVPGQDSACLSTNPHEVVLDRVPPSGTLTLGGSYSGFEDFELSAFAYNTLNAHSYNPTGTSGGRVFLTPVLNPTREFRFIVSAAYRR